LSREKLHKKQKIFFPKTVILPIAIPVAMWYNNYAERGDSGRNRHRKKSLKNPLTSTTQYGIMSMSEDDSHSAKRPRKQVKKNVKNLLTSSTECGIMSMLRGSKENRLRESIGEQYLVHLIGREQKQKATDRRQ
jgi:hypothetical protein